MYLEKKIVRIFVESVLVMRENNKEKLFAQTFSLLLTHNIGDLTLEEQEALWQQAKADLS